MKSKLSLFILFILLIQLITPTNISFADNPEIKVNVDSLNVRSGPSLSTKIIRQIHKNEKYTVVEKRNNWIKIKVSNSITGWVASWLVTETKQPTSNEHIASSVNGLNVRTGPGLSFPVLGQIYPSQTFERLQSEGEWANIDFNGRNGWVASWLITTKKQSTSQEIKIASETAVVEATILNVRSGPSTSYSVIGKLRNGEKVTITNVKNGWYEISYKSKKAWIAGDYVQKGQQEVINDHNQNEQNTTKSATVIATVLNVRNSGSLNGTIIAQLTKNTKVEIIKEKNDWAHIRFNGKTGWVARWYLTAETGNESGQAISQETAPKVTLLHNATNLRSGPSTKYKIIDRGNSGDQFPIISNVGDWYKILLPNKKEAFVAGWIVSVSEQLEPITQTNVSDYVKGKSIVIDPGHGGIDSGAIGCCNRVLEKRLTLETAQILASKLRSAGANVRLTRSDDRYISLLSRVNMSHYYNADAFLSLHYNSSIFPSARGITSFYYDNKQERELARTIQQELVTKTGLRDRGAQFGNYQVLRTNQNPSVLLELGFLSNPEEAYLIQTKSYQEKLTEAIYIGLGKYFN